MELPALAVRAPDLGNTLARVSYLKSAGLQNKLLQSKIDSANTGLALRKEMLGDMGGDATGAGPDIGAAEAPGGAAQGPSRDLLQRYLAIDPEGGKAMIDGLDKLDARDLAAKKQQNENAMKLLLPLEFMPEAQRPMAFAQARAQAAEMGIPMEGVPEQYDPQWTQMAIMRGMTADQYISMKEKAKPKKGDLEPYFENGQMKYRPVYEAPYSAMGKLAEDKRLGRLDNTQYNQGIASMMKPVVQMNQTQETERSKAYGKNIGEYYAKTYVEMQQASRSAREQNARMDRLDQVLDQTSTGKGAETLTSIKAWGKRLGIDLSGLPGNVAPAEAAMALSNEMALQLRNPAGGAGMPGAMSDKDREFLVSMVPGLGQTAEGRKLLIQARKKVNERSIEVAKMARDYQRKHGQLDANFEEGLSSWAGANPLFSEAELTLREKARLPVVGTDEDYEKLAPGTYFTDANGESFQKPMGAQ